MAVIEEYSGKQPQVTSQLFQLVHCLGNDQYPSTLSDRVAQIAAVLRHAASQTAVQDTIDIQREERRAPAQFLRRPTMTAAKPRGMDGEKVPGA